MKKSQLSDKQLEQLLGHMPKVKDHRDPRDIYQNIAHRVEKKKKVPAWVIPGAALAAVLFLAFILSPGLMGINHSTDKSVESNSASDAKFSMEMERATREDSAKESSDKTENSMMMETAESADQKVEEFIALDESDPYSNLNAVYSDEVEGGHMQVLTYAIPDKMANTIVPVTVLAPITEGKIWVGNFTDTMSMLRETEWGLADYYPLDAKWNYDEVSKTLTMDVKENHKFRDGSAANVMFVNTMTQNFADKGIDKLILKTEGREGIDVGNYGVMKELLINEGPPANRAYLFLTPEGAETPFLVPTEEQHESISAAFDQMFKGNKVKKLTASLPEDLKIEQTEHDAETGVLTISLAENTNIDENFLPSLEAILLTAKEFNYKGVKIENANIDQLGPFNMNEVLPLPVAPNKKNID